MLSLSAILFLCFTHIWAQNLSPRIIGGSVASEGEFPYAVAITYVRDGPTSLCGGSLLNSRWVLTAAFCVLNSTDLKVYLGSVNLDQLSSNGLILNATEYVVHPLYDASYSLDHNIGLIYLPRNVTFSNTIQPISLPSARLGVSEVVTVAGWGATSDSLVYANVLYHVALITITNSQCSTIFQGSFISNNMVCAMYYSNEGTCRGDSGGPLVQLDSDGNIIQVGVASFYSGLSCEAEHPSGFTRVFEYVEWINNVTGMIDEPEEPTDKPEEPTDKPEEPTDKPEEPTDKPEEPTDKPPLQPPENNSFPAIVANFFFFNNNISVFSKLF